MAIHFYATAGEARARQAEGIGLIGVGVLVALIPLASDAVGIYVMPGMRALSPFWGVILVAIALIRLRHDLWSFFRWATRSKEQREEQKRIRDLDAKGYKERRQAFMDATARLDLLDAAWLADKDLYPSSECVEALLARFPDENEASLASALAAVRRLRNFAAKNSKFGNRDDAEAIARMACPGFSSRTYREAMYSAYAHDRR